MGLNLKNLKGADTKGFDPIPAGRYDAVVYEAKETEIKADTQGKMDPGTPGVRVQFKVVGGEYDNRRVFTTYWLPDPSYEKAQVMFNIFASALRAFGYDEEEIKSGKLNLDLDDLEDRECSITVNIDDQGYNQVKGVRPRAEATSSIL